MLNWVPLPVTLFLAGSMGFPVFFLILGWKVFSLSLWLFSWLLKQYNLAQHLWSLLSSASSHQPRTWTRLSQQLLWKPAMDNERSINRAVSPLIQKAVFPILKPGLVVSFLKKKQVLKIILIIFWCIHTGLYFPRFFSQEPGKNLLYGHESSGCAGLGSCQVPWHNKFSIASCRADAYQEHRKGNNANTAH